MIFGNGVDIVEIERIRELITKNPRFIERNFSDKERLLFEEKQMRAESIAANFAAKEAVSKSMGTGVRGFNLVDIEVLRNALGKPEVILHNKALEIAREKGIVKFEISLSHSRENAIAFVIALTV